MNLRSYVLYDADGRIDTTLTTTEEQVALNAQMRGLSFLEASNTVRDTSSYVEGGQILPRPQFGEVPTSIDLGESFVLQLPPGTRLSIDDEVVIVGDEDVEIEPASAGVFSIAIELFPYVPIYTQLEVRALEAATI